MNQSIEIKRQVFQQSELFQDQLQEMPIFQYLIDKYQREKPFKNKNIAFAHVLVPNILPMIYLIIIGGGNISITNCCPPTIDRDTIELLEKAGCKVDLNLNSAAQYDYAIDCTGYFVGAPPIFGVAEVTRTGIHRYKKIEDRITVIDIDNSTSKLIETFYGNPLAVLRGIHKFIGNPETVLKNKTMGIIGFGKIGRGLARLFSKYCKLVIFDIDEIAVRKASILKFQAEKITRNKYTNSDKLKNVDIIITCTRHSNVISDYFIKNKLRATLLLNVGASDEYGPDFSSEEVFMSKDRPFNFNLTPPTENKFIDPILAAQVEGLLYLIANEVKYGIHPIP